MNQQGGTIPDTELGLLSRHSKFARASATKVAGLHGRVPYLNKVPLRVLVAIAAVAAANIVVWVAAAIILVNIPS